MEEVQKADEGDYTRTLEAACPGACGRLVAVVGEGGREPARALAAEDRARRRVAIAPDPWMPVIQSTVGDVKAAVQFACVAVLGIAVLDAGSSYTEKYLTTSVARGVRHDLRRSSMRTFNGCPSPITEAQWRSSQPRNQRYRRYPVPSSTLDCWAHWSA